MRQNRQRELLNMPCVKNGYRQRLDIPCKEFREGKKKIVKKKIVKKKGSVKLNTEKAFPYCETKC